MLNFKNRLLLLPLILLSAGIVAQAGELQGKVVSVIDGDTLTLMDQQHRKHTVHMAGIAAPAPGQNYGKQARQNLWRLIGERDVVVSLFETSNTSGLVGTISIQQAAGDLDVGLAQIKAGFAWCNPESPLTENLRSLYFSAEREARNAESGLWRDSHAIAPWEFQRRQRAETYYETVPGF